LKNKNVGELGDRRSLLDIDLPNALVEVLIAAGEHNGRRKRAQRIGERLHIQNGDRQRVEGLGNLPLEFDRRAVENGTDGSAKRFGNVLGNVVEQPVEELDGVFLHARGKLNTLVLPPNSAKPLGVDRRPDAQREFEKQIPKGERYGTVIARLNQILSESSRKEELLEN
jgi:hypothetical protein